MKKSPFLSKRETWLGRIHIYSICHHPCQGVHWGRMKHHHILYIFMKHLQLHSPHLSFMMIEANKLLLCRISCICDSWSILNHALELQKIPRMLVFSVFSSLSHSLQQRASEETIYCPERGNGHNLGSEDTSICWGPTKQAPTYDTCPHHELAMAHNS